MPSVSNLQEEGAGIGLAWAGRRRGESGVRPPPEGQAGPQAGGEGSGGRPTWERG